MGCGKLGLFRSFPRVVECVAGVRSPPPPFRIAGLSGASIGIFALARSGTRKSRRSRKRHRALRHGTGPNDGPALPEGVAKKRGPAAWRPIGPHPIPRSVVRGRPIANPKDADPGKGTRSGDARSPGPSERCASDIPNRSCATGLDRHELWEIGFVWLFSLLRRFVVPPVVVPRGRLQFHRGLLASRLSDRLASAEPTVPPCRKQAATH